MRTIDVGIQPTMEALKIVKIVPKSLVCNKCKILLASLLPNNEKNNFIYGVVITHYRIICGVHEKIVYEPYEEVICFCTKCVNPVREKFPKIFSANDSENPLSGGHFITMSKLNESGKTIEFSRFQGELKDFREIMGFLKN